jgi:hypothetical protein
VRSVVCSSEELSVDMYALVAPVIRELAYADVVQSGMEHRERAAQVVRQAKLHKNEIARLRTEWVRARNEAFADLSRQQHSECLAESCLPGEWLCAETKCGQYTPV